MRYTKGLDYESFTQNDVVFDAVVRRLQVIGEAAARVPSDMRERYPEIEWRKIVGLQDKLRSTLSPPEIPPSETK